LSLLRLNKVPQPLHEARKIIGKRIHISANPRYLKFFFLSGVLDLRYSVAEDPVVKDVTPCH